MKPKQPKDKPCQFKGCEKTFKQYKSTDKFCSRACYLADFASKEVDKKVKVMRLGLITLTQFEKAAKSVFQLWVRLRDKDLPCISCGCVECSEWSGGHWWAAGQYSGLMFHPWNCNKQCNAYCNKYLSGNSNNYRIGLVKKIGEENVKWIEENKDRLKNKKYTRDELIEIANKYKAKIKANDFT
jgi:hypothetical protein